MKTLFILIGPKGAGKTYIGQRIAAHTPIYFLAVEPIWLEYLAQPDPAQSGWDVVAATIEQAFATHDRVMIESLGAGAEFAQFYQTLQQRYAVKLIKVETHLITCADRVRDRDQALQIPVTEEAVWMYNKIAAQVQYDWDQTINNNGPASDAEILQAVQAWL